jgi:septal ring factor EnvC (AmiA/AmiB activator)
MSHNCVKTNLEKLLVGAINTNNVEVIKLVKNTISGLRKYIDNQNIQSKTDVSNAIEIAVAPLVNSINLITKIDSEDGVTTIAEDIQKLNDLLKNGTTLKKLTDSITAVDNRLSSLALRVSTLEDTQKVLKLSQSELKNSLQDVQKQQISQSEKVEIVENLLKDKVINQVSQLITNQDSFLTCDDIENLNVKIDNSVFNININEILDLDSSTVVNSASSSKYDNISEEEGTAQ